MKQKDEPVGHLRHVELWKMCIGIERCQCFSGKTQSFVCYEIAIAAQVSEGLRGEESGTLRRRGVPLYHRLELSAEQFHFLNAIEPIVDPQLLDAYLNPLVPLLR